MDRKPSWFTGVRVIRILREDDGWSTSALNNAPDQYPALLNGVDEIKKSS